MSAHHQPSLADVIKKIRNTDFPYAVNEEWEKKYLDDKHKKKNTKLIFINKNFTREEQSVLLNASAEDLFNAFMRTQPQTFNWSLDNPNIKWPLAASLCVTGAACMASPYIAVPSIMVKEAAGALALLGTASCVSSSSICTHKSNIQEYKEEHGIDEDRIFTEEKDKLYDKSEHINRFANYKKYRGRTLKNYKDDGLTISTSRFIRIIKDLSQYRIHNIADQKALWHIITEMKKLQYTPPTQEDIKAKGYDKSPADINNNESKTQLNNETKLIK